MATFKHVSPPKPRSWESVRTMFTAPIDRRWDGVKGNTANSTRVIEAQQRSR